MNDTQFKEHMTALIGIRETLEEGFRHINMTLDGIGLATNESKNLIDSLRRYTIGKVDLGG